MPDTYPNAALSEESAKALRDWLKNYVDTKVTGGGY